MCLLRRLWWITIAKKRKRFYPKNIMFLVYGIFWLSWFSKHQFELTSTLPYVRWSKLFLSHTNNLQFLTQVVLRVHKNIHMLLTYSKNFKIFWSFKNLLIKNCYEKCKEFKCYNLKFGKITLSPKMWKYIIREN